jgi:hypothetical protein
MDNVHDTFIRMLTFPMITVAALNGHVFAAGAMFALAHDYRVMRAAPPCWGRASADGTRELLTPASGALYSHLLRFAAEEARINRTVVDMTDFRDQAEEKAESM